MPFAQRILHVISRLDGYGGSRILRALTARQAATGAFVVVATLQADEHVVEELAAANVKVERFNARWNVDIVSVARLARMLRRDRFDLVHAWDSAAAAYTMAGGVVSRTSTPRIATVSATSRLIEAPQSVQRRFATWFTRIAVIRPGVPPDLAAATASDRAKLASDLGIAEDAPLIALSGPLIRTKEIDEAIWCYELVRVVHPEARLLLLGDGPDRARLERFAYLVSIPKCIRFCGFRCDQAAILPNVDVFWQLNYSGSTPLAMLEAMAAGRPVVASDAPAHRAAIESGRNGILVPHLNRAMAARATDDVLRDPALGARLGANAKADVARDWSLDAALAAVDRLYQEAIGRQP